MSYNFCIKTTVTGYVLKLLSTSFDNVRDIIKGLNKYIFNSEIITYYMDVCDDNERLLYLKECFETKYEENSIKKSDP